MLVFGIEENWSAQKDLLEHGQKPTTNSNHRWHRIQDFSLGHPCHVLHETDVWNNIGPELSLL